MSAGLEIAAPCKINLHLHIAHRREDGFHELESLFQAVSFGDRIRVESLKERSVCDLFMEGVVPAEQNTVYKVLSAFRAATGYDGGFSIGITKRVPMGSGLGGGSADAAAALLAINKLSGINLPVRELAPLAASVGSDVPFFLELGTAYVTGRGDKVAPMECLSGFAVLLIFPPFTSDTARAYGLLDALRAGSMVPTSTPLGRLAIDKALEAGPRHWPFNNDFLPVFLARGDEVSAYYSQLMEDLGRVGALFASLSGSGSTCFGIFPNAVEAEEAAKRLVHRYPDYRIALPLAR